MDVCTRTGSAAAELARQVGENGAGVAILFDDGIDAICGVKVIGPEKVIRPSAKVPLL